MCGRYTLLADELKISQRFNISQPIKGYKPSYNIAPGQDILAIIYDEEKDEKRAGYLKWGLVPPWAKDKKIGNKMINARSETAHEKPSFKQAMAKKRYLIIADSFYEWKQTDDGKVPQRIQMKNRELFAFAGLWERWESNDEALFTCTMLTTDANEFMRPIHHRMPIILPEEKEDEWIEPSFSSSAHAQQFIRSIEMDPLSAYAVSTYVNRATNNDQQCIEAISE